MSIIQSRYCTTPCLQIIHECRQVHAERGRQWRLGKGTPRHPAVEISNGKLLPVCHNGQYAADQTCLYLVLQEPQAIPKYILDIENTLTNNGIDGIYKGNYIPDSRCKDMTNQQMTIMLAKYKK